LGATICVLASAGRILEFPERGQQQIFRTARMKNCDSASLAAYRTTARCNGRRDDGMQNSLNQTGPRAHQITVRGNTPHGFVILYGFVIF
jgi:hypothetical protein